jgi:hypothetical protein
MSNLSRSSSPRTPGRSPVLASVLSAAASLCAAGVTYAQPPAAPPPPPLRVAFEISANATLGAGVASAAEMHAALLRTAEQRLAAELGRPVVRVARADCARECLHVLLGGATVTQRFTPASGETRQRTIDIAGDATLWPDAVALLAGNLVRDEAASLLEMLPEEQPIIVAAPLIPPPAPGSAPVTMPAQSSPGAAAPPVSFAAPAAAASSSVAADVSVSTVVAPPKPHTPVSFGFVPILSTDFLKVGGVRHDLSLDLVAGISGGSRVFTASGAVDIELGPVSGLQLAGAVSIADELRGAQLSGAVSFATAVRGTQMAGALSIGTEVRGLQLAGAVSFATRSSGSQGAGAVAIAGGSAGLQVAGALTASGGDVGSQIAGAVNLARGKAGLQLAGAANVAGGATTTQLAGAMNISGGRAITQLAGAMNISGGTTHTQVAGAVNIARDVKGVQIAPLNIARKVDGVQVGVVNIGGGNDGISLGLLNIVPGGRTDVEASLDSEGIGAIMLRHGSRRWHNVYGVAGQRVSDDLSSGTDDVWMYGLGFGPTFTRGKTSVDLEAMGWEVSYGDRHARELSILTQLRLTVAHDFGPLSVVGGGVVNTFITDDHSQPFLERKAQMPTTDEVTTKTWLSAFVGLRL